MKRTAKEAKATGGRWGKEPKTCTPRELRASLEVIRERLMEIAGICDRMDERHIESLTIAGGGGSEAYDRAEAAIGAWARGLRAALLEHIKHAE